MSTTTENPIANNDREDDAKNVKNKPPTELLIPILRKQGSLHDKENEHDDPLNSDDEDDEDDEEEEGFYAIARVEALDAIEEAWEHRGDDFRLQRIRLDRHAIEFLMNKWDTLCMARQEQERRQQRQDDSSSGESSRSKAKKRRRRRNRGKTIKKLVLDRCSFSGAPSVHLMITLLQKIGTELKEVRISDSCTVHNPQGNTHYHVADDLPGAALLGGLKYTRPLERLDLERADLRGRSNGYHLQNVLTRSPKLATLQMYGSLFDDDMFELFLLGLQSHWELQRLDLGGWTLNEKQLHLLVDALVHCAPYKKLRILDVSGATTTPSSTAAMVATTSSSSKATALSATAVPKTTTGEAEDLSPSQSWTCPSPYQSLTRLLRQTRTLQELVLSSASYEDVTTAAALENPDCRAFVEALRSNQTLQRLRLGHSTAVPPSSSSSSSTSFLSSSARQAASNNSNNRMLGRSSSVVDESGQPPQDSSSALVLCDGNNTASSCTSVFSDVGRVLLCH